MLTLQILVTFFIIGTVGSIMLLKDGYVRHAKFLFFNMTCTPIGLLLIMILMLGAVPIMR